MDYKEKYLKYKTKYVLEKLNQHGGVVIIPEVIRHLLARNSDGSFDVTDSIDAFADRWVGTTPFNLKRRAFLHHCFDPFITTHPEVSLNILNPRGNGNCFYECIFMWAKMSLESFPFGTYEDLKSAVLSLIETDEQYIKDFGDFLQNLLEQMRDPNCPDLDIPINKICQMFTIKVCVISIQKKSDNLSGNIRKYGDGEDCVTIIVAEGHVYLVDPRTERGSSLSLRCELYESIP